MGHISHITKTEKHINSLMRVLEVGGNLTEKDRAELCCYLRQRQGMLESMAWLSSHSARALLYISRMWMTRGESILPLVKFSAPYNPPQIVVFYYEKMLRLIEQVQHDIKIYDSELNYGFEDQDGEPQPQQAATGSS